MRDGHVLLEEESAIGTVESAGVRLGEIKRSSQIEQTIDFSVVHPAQRQRRVPARAVHPPAIRSFPMLVCIREAMANERVSVEQVGDAHERDALLPDQRSEASCRRRHP